MTYDNLLRLLDKYWEGQASDAEEAAIRDWYASQAPQDLPEAVAAYAPYFAALEEMGQPSPLGADFDAQLLQRLTSPTVRRLPLYQRWQSWAVAASAALVLGWAIGYWMPRTATPHASEYIALESLSEAEQEAYHQTRTALLYVSTHLNRGTRIVQEQMQRVNAATQEAIEQPDEYQVELEQ